MIGLNPGVTQRELRTMLGREAPGGALMSRAGMSGLIDRMATRGRSGGTFIDARTNPADRRVDSLRLTPEGEQYLADILGHLR